MKNLAIIGTGGFARELLCILDDLDKYNNVVGFFEPDNIWNSEFRDCEIMGLNVLPYSDLKDSYQISVGIGDPSIRQIVVSELGSSKNYSTIIHPNTQISRWTSIDLGVIITAGCILTCNIELGKQAHLNLQTTIGHDCQIGDFFTSAPSVNISGNCNIGKSVYFGTGSATRQGISICDNVIVGMGAMVVKNITNPGTYVGIPA